MMYGYLMFDPRWMRSTIKPLADNTYDIGDATHTIRSLYLGTSLKSYATTGKIVSGTSDGSDNKSFYLCGGGDNTASRGSYLGTNGNEVSSVGGYWELGTGDASGALGIIKLNSSTSKLSIRDSSSNVRFSFDASTNFLFGSADCSFMANTSDGSDSLRLMFCGGGAISDTRGSYFILGGNEHSSYLGSWELHAGNVSTGSGIINLPHSSAVLRILMGGSEQFRAVYGGTLAFGTGVDITIRSQTSDGSDNKTLYLTGGGGAAVGRGGYIRSSGNEVSTVGGSLYLYAGDVSTGLIVNVLTNSSSSFQVQDDSANVLMSVNKTGQLSTTRSHGGIAQSLNAAVAAAGSNLSGATQLTSWYNAITSGNTGTEGVKLDGSMLTGQAEYIANNTGLTLKAYPPDASSHIYTNGVTDLGAGTAMNLTDSKIYFFIKISSTIWHSFVVN